MTAALAVSALRIAVRVGALTTSSWSTATARWFRALAVLAHEDANPRHAQRSCRRCRANSVANSNG
ncbi:MAG: hypothetical protein M3P48_01710 [Actinomycetota bacterium]|nr:hypothetical protein [Actinomycetota bacterium]